jgi:hypothetical protein|tara:strand:- start:214 stop:1350 length:1137 start_codon:yes stop_codon:yes gene_type:complete
MYNIDNFNVSIDNTDIGAMVTSMTIYESIHGNIKAAFTVDDKLNFFDVFFRGITLSIVKISYTYFDVPTEIVLYADGVMDQKITKTGKSYTVKAVSINNLNEATARICNAYSGTSSDILGTIWQETHGAKNLLVIDSEVSSNGKYIAPNVSATMAFKDIVSTAYCKRNTPMFLYQRLADNGITRFTSIDQMLDSNYLTTNGRDFTLHTMSQSIDSLKTPLQSVGSSSSFILTDYNMDFIKKVSGGMWGKSIMAVSLDETTDTVLKPAEVTAVPVTKYSLSEHLFDEKSIMSGDSSTSSTMIMHMKYRLFNTILMAADVVAVPGLGCGMTVNVEQGSGQISSTKTDGYYIVSDINHTYIMEDGKMQYSQNIGLVREGNK